jgi:hypothetical protein
VNTSIANVYVATCDWPAPLAGDNTWATATVPAYGTHQDGDILAPIGSYVSESMVWRPASLGAVVPLTPLPFGASYYFGIDGWNGSTPTLSAGYGALTEVWRNPTDDTYRMVPHVLVQLSRGPGHDPAYPPANAGPRPDEKRTSASVPTWAQIPIQASTSIAPGLTLVGSPDRVTYATTPGESWTALTPIFRLPDGTYTKTPTSGGVMVGYPAFSSSSGIVEIIPLAPRRSRKPATAPAITSLALNQPAWIGSSGTYQSTADTARWYLPSTVVAGTDGTFLFTIDSGLTAQELDRIRIGTHQLAPCDQVEEYSQTVATNVSSVAVTVRPFPVSGYDYSSPAGTTIISFTLSDTNVVPESVSTEIASSGGSIFVTDDGAGAFTIVSTWGPGIASSSIDYATGLCSITFDSDASNGDGSVGVESEYEYYPPNISGTIAVTTLKSYRLQIRSALVWSGPYHCRPETTGTGSIPRWHRGYDQFFPEFPGEGFPSVEDIAYPATYDDTASAGFPDYYGDLSNRAIVQVGIISNSGTSFSTDTPAYKSVLIRRLSRMVARTVPSGWQDNPVLRPACLPDGWVAVDGGGTIPQSIDAIPAALNAPGGALGYGTIRFQVLDNGATLTLGRPKWDAGTGELSIDYFRTVAMSVASSASDDDGNTYYISEGTWTPSDDGMEFYCGTIYYQEHIATPENVNQIKEPCGTFPYGFRVPRFLGGNASGEDYLFLEGAIPTSMLTYGGGHELSWEMTAGSVPALTGTVDTGARTVVVAHPTTQYQLRPTAPDPMLAQPVNDGYNDLLHNKWELNHAVTRKKHFVLIVSDDRQRFLRSITSGISEWSSWGPICSNTDIDGWVAAKTVRPADPLVTLLRFDLYLNIFWNHANGLPVVSRRYLRTWEADLATGSWAMIRDDFPA